jgi:hypothetical protein
MGAPDESLTENGGLVVVSALERRLGMTATLDDHIGPVKERDRGWTGGEFMTSLATLHLLGHDQLVGFDRMRADEVGDGISPVPAPAATTAATLAARRGQPEREGIETASAQLTATVLDQLCGCRLIIRPVQAACWYSWRVPPSRSCRTPAPLRLRRHMARAPVFKPLCWHYA